MNKGYMRCEFMSPVSGLQCEIWEEAREIQHDASGNRLDFFCKEHRRIKTQNGSEKTQYIEVVNIQREFCYKMFENCSQDEGFAKLDAHIAKIEAEIENQKNLLFTSRAVRADKLSNLSDEERKERLKYKVKKEVKAEGEKTTNIKTNPLAHLQKHGLSADKAKDLLTMDVNELIKKYQQKKGQ